MLIRFAFYLASSNSEKLSCSLALPICLKLYPSITLKQLKYNHKYCHGQAFFHLVTTLLIDQTASPKCGSQMRIIFIVHTIKYVIKLKQKGR